MHVDGPSADLWRVRTETGHHGGCRVLVGHLEEGLVLALEHEHVGHATELHAQLDDFRLTGLVRYVPDVDDARFT